MGQPFSAQTWLHSKSVPMEEQGRHFPGTMAAADVCSRKRPPLLPAYPRQRNQDRSKGTLNLSYTSSERNRNASSDLSLILCKKTWSNSTLIFYSVLPNRMSRLAFFFDGGFRIFFTESTLELFYTETFPHLYNGMNITCVAYSFIICSLLHRTF